MRLILLMAAILFTATNAFAEHLITISDPPNDDYGNGHLTYPRNANFESGDLDLRQLRITRNKEGFWFEAQFSNPVRNPANAFDVIGGGNLADFSRRGFYNFNIDVYVDTDRSKQSGNTFTLPGRRGLRIDEGYAWEKAVILTPRPESIREQMIDALAKQYPERSVQQLAASTDATIFFPVRVQVRGKSVSFFVPQTFFGNSDGSDWAVTAMVTGAQIAQPIHLNLIPSSKSPLEELELGVLQPFQGQPAETFGFGNNPKSPSPVVDALLPTVELQQLQLSGEAPLTGTSWGQHAVDDKKQMQEATRHKPITALNPTTPMPTLPIGKLLQPDTVVTAKPAEITPAPTVQVTEPSISKRLQTLQQLFDEKLIDESEYKQQKQRILKEL